MFFSENGPQNPILIIKAPILGPKSQPCLCDQEIKWAKSDGIFANPSWDPGLPGSNYYRGLIITTYSVLGVPYYDYGFPGSLGQTTMVALITYSGLRVPYYNCGILGSLGQSFLGSDDLFGKLAGDSATGEVRTVFLWFPIIHPSAVPFESP